MPGGDRTGPAGYGPRTGRGLGDCSGNNNSGFAKATSSFRGWGRGFGRGFWGRGRGFQRRDYYSDLHYGLAPYYRDTYPETNKDEEKSYLENMVKNIEVELKAIKERLQELSKEKEEVP